MRSPLLLLLFLLIGTLAKPDLLDDEEKGRILGTSFGVPGADASYDYVVVGGGTAGLTIAARLAEDPSLTVAVVEAGGFYELDNGNLSVIPAFAVFYTGSDPKDTQPLIDWGFKTTPQPGAANRQLHYARGKTLGGSSARNYMFYHRGTVQSYQKWADEVDDQSYTFDNFLPYFKKSVHYTPAPAGFFVNSTNSQTPAAFSPYGGPLQVSFGGYVDPFGTWFQRGLEAFGMKQIDGFNSGKLLGSAYATLTVDGKNAHRSSSESSFLQTAVRNGTSLTVYKNTLAQRIQFDSNKTATGVKVTTAGTYGTPSVDYILHARKEVIVSAGTFQSPQLLMVSGIGPPKQLQKHGIPCVHELAGVGENMWDHVSFGVSHRVNVQTASAGLNDPSLNVQAAEAYLTNATGPLATFGSGYYGWEKLPDPYRSELSESSRDDLEKNFPADWPELEYLPVNGYAGYQQNHTLDPADGYNYASIISALVSPLSRGRVTLQDANMSTPPLIDPQWLTARADVELALQAFRRQRQIWQYFAKQGLVIGEEVLPGANVTSDDDILEYIGQSCIEVWHAAATCKMGLKADSMAVVDAEARVFGVHGLRVVDASAMPFLPPGHPQATIYALAEKIAAGILRGLRQ